MYGAECMEAVAHRHDLTSLREDLRSAASLTEMILDSKDVELLLLKNDVQNKLGNLTQDDDRFTPPTTASKVSHTVQQQPQQLEHSQSADSARRITPASGSKDTSMIIFITKIRSVFPLRKTTDLYKYSIPDAVPPIHAVSSHVATDKGPSKLGSIFSDNLQPIATRGKKARGTLSVDSVTVPVSAHPSPLVTKRN